MGGMGLGFSFPWNTNWGVRRKKLLFGSGFYEPLVDIWESVWERLSVLSPCGAVGNETLVLPVPLAFGI